MSELLGLFHTITYPSHNFSFLPLDLYLDRLTPATLLNWEQAQVLVWTVLLVWWASGRGEGWGVLAAAPGKEGWDRATDVSMSVCVCVGKKEEF